MGLSSLVLGALLLPLLPRASSATVVFSSCIDDNCIGHAACGVSSPQCMCRAARGSFLDNVLVCMYHHCTDELPDADALFLQRMENGCAELQKPIPESSMEEAENILGTLIARLPEPTTAARSTPTTTEGPRLGKTTAQPRTSDSEADPTSTSSPADETTISLSPTTSTEAPTTTEAPPTSSENPPAQATSESSKSSSSKTKRPNLDPTDSSPFATPRSAASSLAFSFSLVASIPLVVAAAVVLR